MPGLAQKIAQMRAEWGRLSARDRRAILLGLSVVLGLITLAVGFGVWSTLSSLEERNAAMRDVLKEIALHREEFLDARRRMASQEVRVSRTPVALSSLVESAAKESGIQIAQSADRPTSPRGKRFIEKGVDLQLRNLDLQSLTKFLKRIETGPSLVVVDRLRVTTRFNEHDKLEIVEMGVLTYEHAPAAPKKGTAGAGEGDKT
jgi:hypothetical protein